MKRSGDEMIIVSAFSFQGDNDFYHWRTGNKIDAFAGFVMVYFKDGYHMIFKTGLNKYSERYWCAVGNKPTLPFRYGDI